MPTPVSKTDVAMAASGKDAQKKAARAKFEGAWAVIRDELLAHMRAENMPPDAQEWYRRVRTRFVLACKERGRLMVGG